MIPCPAHALLSEQEKRGRTDCVSERRTCRPAKVKEVLSDQGRSPVRRGLQWQLCADLLHLVRESFW